MVRKSLNTHGTLLVYLLCRLLTVGCFQKNRFGEIVNSGSQNNSKVQSTLRPNHSMRVNTRVLRNKNIPLTAAKHFSGGVFLLTAREIRVTVVLYYSFW